MELNPLKDNVNDLLPSGSPRRSLAQATMESQAVVAIYESRFLRRSPLFAALMTVPNCSKWASHMPLRLIPTLNSSVRSSGYHRDAEGG